MIILFKILATILTVGLTIPAGLISPSLFIGGMIGCLVGLMIQVVNFPVSPPGFYVMPGMAAMMGATLQAPLAALLALIELTGNVNIIFPGMLAVISANLAAKELFTRESVYLSQIKGIGLDYKNDPVSQSLRRLAVTSVMNKSFVIVDSEVDCGEAEELLTKTNPHWLIVNKEEEKLLMPAADLAHFLKNNEDEKAVNLLEIPSNRRQIVPVRKQATLQQALMTIEEASAEAVYILGFMGFSSDPIYGVATKQDITEAYRMKGPSSYY